ncbi:MAG: TatD family hydrolase [Aphanocapsa sp. GSE-SYN-MK-11-07L]|jgi:TatD DNase family protein|nr:TatD family hydrolase [Aphanocapsa sp. GSE-SYN-MK-11-07L]
MQLVDSHVHLNFAVFEPDLEAIAQRWREAGVFRLVHSCVEPSEFPAIQALAQRFPELYFAVGLHPLDATQWQPGAEAEIDRLAQSDPKVVAIGETGLDFFKADNQVQQEQAFWAHLQIAQRLNLPVIIHCRDAAVAMSELLHRFWQTHGPVRGVMHCWAGSPAETEWFLDLGFYVSFSGIVTFKNASQIHASAAMMPSDRLLIETDCPFLAPVPKRGEKRNEPAYVRYVAAKVAQLRQTSLDSLARETTANACQLFSLPTS